MIGLITASGADGEIDGVLYMSDNDSRMMMLRVSTSRDMGDPLNIPHGRHSR